MSERKAGWYWVEYGRWGRWQCAHWDGQGWHLLGISKALHAARMTRVGDRIPTPDEPWQCVPEEPAVEMIHATQYKEGTDELYEALLSAAPKPEDV